MNRMHLRITVALATCGIVALGGLAACAPQHNDETGSEGANAESTQVAFTWSYDSTCAQCHEKEDGSMDDAACLAAMHAAEGTTCATCHTDEQGLASVHEGKTASDAMPKKLKKTAVEAQTCQSSGCHNETADEMTALTAGYTELVDTKGTQVNPHEVMGLTEGHADITCSNCHNMHEAEVAAADTCVSCHHAGVYECNTCH